MLSFISFSFGDGRAEKTVDSRCRLPIIFYYWIHTHCRFRIFYYGLENAASSHHGTEHRIFSVLVVRHLIVCLRKTCTILAFTIYKASIRDRFIPESARWLLTKGRLQEAKDLLQHASLENGVEMPSEALDTLLNNNEDSMPDMKKPSLFDLFRYPNLRRKSILLFFNWYDDDFITYIFCLIILRYFGFLVRTGL